MENHKFSKSSIRNLSGVHPALIIWVTTTLRYSNVDFGVYEGIRSLDTQRAYFRAGWSRSMDSRHLTGHAIDVLPVGVRGNWDDYWHLFGLVAHAGLRATKDTGILVTWGGTWPGLRDGPHFELDRTAYPVETEKLVITV